MRRTIDKIKSTVLFIYLGMAVVSIVFFYILTNGSGLWFPIRWVSFVFILIAETAGIIKAVAYKRTVIGFANISTSIIHIMAVFIVSILFVWFFPKQVKIYVLLNIMACAAMLAFDAAVSFFNDFVKKENNKLAYSMGLMNDCYIRAQSMCIEHSDSVYIKELEKISDMIKYSDNTINTRMDNMILENLRELNFVLCDGVDEEVKKKITEVMNVIQARSVQVKAAKRGSF